MLLARDSEFACRESEYRNWKERSQSDERPRGYRHKYRFPRTTPYFLTKSYHQQVLRSAGETGLILNLGSGRRKGPDERWVQLDLLPHHHCDVIADAHFLPFASGSFSAAVSHNVFEYLNPMVAAAELERVVMGGGMLYVSVAFMLPITNPGDYFRYTAEGLRSVFRNWEIVATGASAGPFMALARVVERIADTLLPGRVLSFLGAWCSAWALHPLKYLDPWLLRRDAEGRAASAFFVLARRPDTARTATDR